MLLDVNIMYLVLELRDITGLFSLIRELVPGFHKPKVTDK
jgi:hypothetical protein